MISLIRKFFKNSFGFNDVDFENCFFKRYYIPYKKICIDGDYWKYSSRDIIYKVNSLHCIVLLNEKEMFKVEFIHNIDKDCEHLFNCIKKFY